MHVCRNIPARLITSTTNRNSPASYTLWHPRASGGFNYNGSESSACSSEGCAARDRLDAVSAPRASASTRVFLSRQWVPSPPRYSGLKYCPLWNKTQSPLIRASWAQQPRQPVLITSATRGAAPRTEHTHKGGCESSGLAPAPSAVPAPSRGCAEAAPGEGFPHLMGASFRRGEAIRDTKKDFLPS